uniref:Uncharacterized protein n=1 Tax=Macrostomum lignano TaxID=282301 RepID=A0A1I8JP86_9PLAT
MNFLWACWPRC